MGKCASIFEVCKGSSKVDSGDIIEVKISSIRNTADLTASVPGQYFSEPEEMSLFSKHMSDVFLLPKKVSHYQVSECIGQGSFGKVLLGVNEDTGELIAIKRVPMIELCPESAHQSIMQIKEEVKILSRLNHKNIVRYYGMETTTSSLNIFMEYIAGGSISSKLKEYGKFNEKVIREYTKQILEGLEYIHYHKVIHRDLKGANILVGDGGVCKLADFGSAKQFRGVNEDSEFKSLRGTTNWMAPEVMRQEGSGRFSDIWSLGCVVVEMATGKPPWSDKSNPIAVFMHVCNSDQVPKLPDDTSDVMRDFIARCFKRKPEERPNVCKLLSHPFITIVSSPLSLSLKQSPDSYSLKKDYRMAASLPQKLKKIVERNEGEKRVLTVPPRKVQQFMEPENSELVSVENLEGLKPEHGVKRPFNIESAIRLEEEAELVDGFFLGRPDDSEISESIESSCPDSSSFID
jgi:serine/threonine protein kinase